MTPEEIEKKFRVYRKKIKQLEARVEELEKGPQSLRGKKMNLFEAVESNYKIITNMAGALRGMRSRLDKLGDGSNL